jgi:phosphate starvation-inducible PhoH-like protein
MARKKDCKDSKKCSKSTSGKTPKPLNEKRAERKCKKLDSIQPLNYEQSAFLGSIEQCFLTICQGRAGTGKTFLALVNALKLVYKGKFDKILYVRAYIPQLSVEKDMGALPGEASSKMAPCATAVADALLHVITEKELEVLYTTGAIEVSNVSFLRGRSLDRTIIIFDEAQMADFNLAHMVISRAGKDSKVIITGSLSQIDKKARYESFLPSLIDVLADNDRVGVVELNDIVRNEDLNDILEALESVM